MNGQVNGSLNGLAAGRAWAYAGAALGVTVSVLGNVAHVLTKPSPGAAELVGASVWPLLVLTAVEILTRVPWPDGSGWLWVRWGGLLPIAVAAGVVSYQHLAGLLASWGESPVTVWVGPAAVDGLMLLSSAALLVEPPRRPQQQRQRQASPQVTREVKPSVTPQLTPPREAVRPHLVPSLPDASGDAVGEWVRQQREAGRRRADVIREGVERWGVSKSTIERRWAA